MTTLEYSSVGSGLGVQATQLSHSHVDLRGRVRSRLPPRQARSKSIADHYMVNIDDLAHSRRSQDDTFAMPKSFIVDVKSTLRYLILNEDTDKDGHITIEDVGPKNILLGTIASNGYRKFPVSGPYAISNLFQDLSAAQDEGQLLIELKNSQLNQDPVARLENLISTRFWDHLTRRLDAKVMKDAMEDDKAGKDQVRRLYVPPECEAQYDHYVAMARDHSELNLEVKKLPSSLTDSDYKTLGEKPGLVSLDMEWELDPLTGVKRLSAVPFVVPGGWFNEFFGWDSYFIGLGLFLEGKTDLVKCIVKNWIFEIQHYGLIPNANRSYLMLRSQPPFLTDLCLRLYKATLNTDPEAKAFLKRGIEAAIKEYHSVWVTEPRLDRETGLSRYRPKGTGVTTEVGLEFYRPILKPFADKYKTTVEDLAKRFNEGQIHEPDLDDYFLHDRALRESGHDTQNRLEGKTADLAIIDLNFLLYKFETDIAHVIEDVFGGDFELTQEFMLATTTKKDSIAATWRERATKRREAINKYLWNEEQGIYLDYNTKTKRQEKADSATCFWALWCGVASPHQAEQLVKRGLPLFECIGGLASSSERTGYMYRRRPYQSQWDYPHGWAPHQIMAWDGLTRYGFHEEAARLAYRWLSTILKVFVNYNGCVVEKYDVTRPNNPHQVDTEYPNQGFTYEGYVKEGFGWTNASFTYGLTFLNGRMRRALGVLAPWEALRGR